MSAIFLIRMIFRNINKVHNLKNRIIIIIIYNLIWITLYNTYLIPPLLQFAHLREKQMSRTRTCQFIIAFLKAQFYHSSVATFIRAVIGNSVLRSLRADKFYLAIHTGRGKKTCEIDLLLNFTKISENTGINQFHNFFCLRRLC